MFLLFQTAWFTNAMYSTALDWGVSYAYVHSMEFQAKHSQFLSASRRVDSVRGNGTTVIMLWCPKYATIEFGVELMWIWIILVEFFLILNLNFTYFTISKKRITISEWNKVKRTLFNRVWTKSHRWIQKESQTEYDHCSNWTDEIAAGRRNRQRYRDRQRKEENV